MRFALSDLAAQLGGELVGPDRDVSGVAIDSRQVLHEQLFVPLVAERDGHTFVEAALQRQAGGYIASRPVTLPTELRDTSFVKVDDTASALSEIGRLSRARLDGPVIGITGSVGKTSVKDLAAAACSSTKKVAASKASFNNEIGVPLTLANAEDDTEVMIVEMGARGIGHIATLCDVAQPTIGLVTTVALAHSELFGSIEGVAQGKGELIESLPESGTAVLNANDPLVMAMSKRTQANIITFGSTVGNGHRGSSRQPDIALTALSLDAELRPRVTISSEWGAGEAVLEARGAHMAHNATAALGVAIAAGVSFESAFNSVASAGLSDWRMSVATSPSGLVVVNDSYNANPTSTRAALQSFEQLPAKKKIAVLGVMAELGEEGPSEHQAIATEAVAANMTVIAVDTDLYGPGIATVSTIDEAHAQVVELIAERADSAVLVKGSRVAGLERLAERLLDD